MAAGKWLDEIRARVAARGVPVADLARAAGMERSNLRRLLSNTAATPRLGTVMRLLAPLDSWVMPPGARTVGELMLFLDGERDRRGASWEALLAGSRLAAATFIEHLHETPERLPLDVVLHVADRLEIELKIAETHDPPAASHDDESRKRPRHRGGSRSSRARSRPAAPRPPEPIGPAPAASRPRSVEVPPPPPGQSPASSPWRLCPPRLGRYRDAPPPPPAPRAPAVAAYVPPEPRYELERALLYKLAEVSRDEWRDVYQGLYEFFTGALDAPLDFFDRAAARTERWFRRLRPAGSDLEPQPRAEVSCEDVDPSPFIDAWRAMTSDPDRRTTEAFHDAAGRANVAHPAVSGAHHAVVQLGQGGRPHRLVMITEATSDGLQVIAKVDVRLELKVGDAVYPFAHIHAGPVFGVLEVSGRRYLLGVISPMLALIEVTRTSARALWIGFAEDLEKTPLEVRLAPANDSPRIDAPLPISESPGPAIDPTPTAPDRDPHVDPHRAALEAELAAVRRELAEERAHWAGVQRQADEAKAALASSEHARLALQHQFAAELAAVRRSLEEEHAHRIATQQRADATESARASWEHERMALQHQLAEERAARSNDEQVVRATVAEFLRVFFSMAAELDETRRRLRVAEQVRQDADVQQTTMAELASGEQDEASFADTKVDAVNETTRPSGDVVAAAAKSEAEPSSGSATTPGNDDAAAPDGQVVAPPGIPEPDGLVLDEAAPADPEASALAGGEARQRADQTSTELHEAEAAYPSDPAASSRADIMAGIEVVGCSGTPRDDDVDPGATIVAQNDPATVPEAVLEASQESVAATCRQSTHQTAAESCEIEAIRSLGSSSADETTPPPASTASTPAKPMHRLVIRTARGAVASDAQVPEDQLAYWVGAWMLAVPDCRVYVDDILVPDAIRALVAGPRRDDAAGTSAIHHESGATEEKAEGVASTPAVPRSEAAVVVEPRVRASEREAKRPAPRTVTASKLASVDPPDPPKPRLAKSLTKKWRR